MFHQQINQSGYLAQRKIFFFPEISTLNHYPASQILLFIVVTRAWLINRMVGNVTGPSPQKNLVPFTLYKLLLNPKTVCALTDDSTLWNAEHSCLIKVSIYPSLGQKASVRLRPEPNQKPHSKSCSQLMALFQDQSIFPHKAQTCHPNSISTLRT